MDGMKSTEFNLDSAKTSWASDSFSGSPVRRESNTGFNFSEKDRCIFKSCCPEIMYPLDYQQKNYKKSTSNNHLGGCKSTDDVGSLFHQLNKVPELTNKTQIFYKTVMCPWYNSGNCFGGMRCNYAHSNAELRPKPNLCKTRMCPSLLEKGFCSTVDCRFAHELVELREDVEKEKRVEKNEDYFKKKYKMRNSKTTEFVQSDLDLSPNNNLNQVGDSLCIRSSEKLHNFCRGTIHNRNPIDAVIGQKVRFRSILQEEKVTSMNCFDSPKLNSRGSVDHRGDDFRSSDLSHELNTRTSSLSRRHSLTSGDLDCLDQPFNLEINSKFYATNSGRNDNISQEFNSKLNSFSACENRTNRFTRLRKNIKFSKSTTLDLLKVPKEDVAREVVGSQLSSERCSVVAGLESVSSPENDHLTEKAQKFMISRDSRMSGLNSEKLGNSISNGNYSVYSGVSNNTPKSKLCFYNKENESAFIKSKNDKKYKKINNEQYKKPDTNTNTIRDMTSGQSINDDNELKVFSGKQLFGSRNDTTNLSPPSKYFKLESYSPDSGISTVSTRISYVSDRSGIQYMRSFSDYQDNFEDSPCDKFSSTNSSEKYNQNKGSDDVKKTLVQLSTIAEKSPSKRVLFDSYCKGENLEFPEVPRQVPSTKTINSAINQNLSNNDHMRNNVCKFGIDAPEHSPYSPRHKNPALKIDEMSVSSIISSFCLFGVSDLVKAAPLQYFD